MSDTDMSFVAKEDNDNWQTPDTVWQTINSFHEINTDPCAGSELTGEETFIGSSENIRPPRNGLDTPWPGVVFMNPPFSQKKKWLKKAVEEVKNGEATTVYAVTPDSTDVMSWWHKHIAENAICSFFPYGRIEYVDPNADEDESSSGASFGSAISVFGKQPPQELLDYWTDDSERPHGDLVVRPQNGFEL